MVNYKSVSLGLVLYGLFVQTTPVHSAPDCRTPPDPDRPQYIIGYGSLMETASKRRTAPLAGENLPVRVGGFQRGWYVRGGVSAPTTFLGVIPQASARMNAVIYRLPLTSELTALDRREDSYCRYPVSPSQIEMLDRSVRPDGQVWIYGITPAQKQLPDPQFPIVQSYVDIVIGGCLEIQETFNLTNFAEECVTTTKDWSTHWVNDRLYPRRPFIYQPRARSIDQVLQKLLPTILPQRQIE